MPPYSLGSSLRSISGSGPGFFQITDFVLGLRVWEILYMLFKNRVCFLQLQLSCMQAALVLKTTHLGGLSSQCRTHSMGSLMWGLDHSLLGEIIWNYDYPSPFGLPTKGVWFLTVPCLHSFYLSHCGPIFMSLVEENLFCWSSCHSHR